MQPGKLERNRLLGIVVTIVCVLGCVATRAQIAGNGQIQGTIQDATGSVVPGAEVIATNTENGTKTTSTSTTSGFYVLSPLAPGSYVVNISKSGYATYVQRDVRIDALTVRTLDFTLQVGEATQNVVVSAAPPALNTSDSTLGITIDNRSYSSLPLAMNGGPMPATGILTLLPGVVRYPLTGAFVFNGGETDTNQIYVNGLPNVNNQDTGLIASLNLGFSIDSVNQFQVDTNGTPAMYQGQGVMNFELKSGTDQLHGTAYDYVRNTIFDAAGFFNSKTPIEKQNEFGASLGGPIIKHRLFYFGNYDGYRLRKLAQFQFNSLPTTAERAGDFSALPVPIYDPATTVCGEGGGCTRSQFSYNGTPNVIPPGRLSDLSKKLQASLPAPINDELQNNYLGGLTPGTNQDRFLVKVDAVVTDKDHIYGFVNWGNLKNPTLPPGGTVLPLPYTSARFSVQSTDTDGFGYTHIFSPHVVNVFNAEYNRLLQAAVNPTAGGNWSSKLGFGGLPPGVASDIFPPINFGGPNSPTPWDIPSYTQVFSHTNNTYGFGDSLQWTHGKQNTTVGTQISILQVGQNLDSALGGFNFGNTETAGFDSEGNVESSTGNSYASFLLGDVDSASATAYPSSIRKVGISNRAYSFFVQDNVKWSSRLTLNLGLRYDIYTPMIEQRNRVSWLNPTAANPAIGGYPGAMEFGGYGKYSCSCRTPAPTHFWNLGPRFGFAYSIDPKTVVRGGYGIFYVQGGATGGSDWTTGSGQTGYSATPSFTSLNSGISPAFNWDSGFPSYTEPPFISPTVNTGFTTTTPSGGAVNAFGDYSRASRAPYMQDWSLTIGRQITPTIIANVSYSASVGHFLATNIGMGAYSNEMLPKYLALGTLLNAPANPGSIALAQAQFPEIALPYANFSGSIVQMLRPFPQYSSVLPLFPMSGNSAYHSLQVSVQKHLSHGLTFLVSYTHAKQVDDVQSNNGLLNAFFLGSGRTAYNAGLDRSIGIVDIPNNLVISYVYGLPFGTGHSFGSTNPVVRAIASNWQLAGIQTYQQGTTLGAFSGVCNAPGTGKCYANYNKAFTGSVRINGKYGDGATRKSSPSYINVNAFSNPAAYTLGDTPRTMAYGLRNAPYIDEDFTLSRAFTLPKETQFQLSASAFNAFNRTVFSGVNTNITSGAFGKISGQGNTARNLQFNARFTF